MSNKFLPFIVESSTPKHIYKTLLSRSKGMNFLTVSSIFNLTLNVDIKKLRAAVKDLPDMQLEVMYEELLQKFPQYRVNEVTMHYFRSMPKYIPERQWWCNDLDEFTTAQLFDFMCVMCMNKDSTDMEEYSDIDFSGLINHETHLKNFHKAVKFSDEGQNKVFSSVKDLKAFVLYNAVLRVQMQPKSQAPEICASLVKERKTKNGESDFEQWTAEQEERDRK